MTETAISVRGLCKAFGKLKAVDNISLEIKAGQVFTLLGPSGCGKTTTLRMIAGLERPDSGEIDVNGHTVVAIRRGIFFPPEKRNLGMVFQSYAIWPHMTVFNNVAYPLRLRRVKRSLIREKVLKALNLVGLEGLQDRLAPHLSGGQQQRVALARALVYEPEVLLLDEPLSNLDAKLREQMRLELKMLQRRLSVTVVYVTHDQIEALSLSDRVVVLNQGKIEQEGVPRDLYERPNNAFVRDFLGRTVILEGNISYTDSSMMRVRLKGAPEVLLDVSNRGVNSLTTGQEVYLSVRPEDVSVRSDSFEGENTFQATVETLLFIGDRLECQFKLGSGSLLTYVPRNISLHPGEDVRLHVCKDAINVWPI